MKVKGFTLVELLTVLAIAGILLGLGVPAFQHFIARHQSQVVASDLIGLLNFARANAVIRAKTVSLCPLGANLTCGSDWSKGAMAFVDADRDGKRTPSEPILRIMEELPPGSTLKWGSFGSKKYLRFAPTGATIVGNGSFTYCPPNGEAKYANQVVVNYTGRVRIAPDRNNNGIKEDSKGKDISCS